MTMAHTQRMIVKIQAQFRRLLTMKKLEKDVNVMKAKLESKKNQPLVSNEELALREFKTRLAKKGLTPEAFYRTCDPSYSKVVKVDDFKKMLLNFKLNLRRQKLNTRCGQNQINFFYSIFMSSLNSVVIFFNYLGPLH